MKFLVRILCGFVLAVLSVFPSVAQESLSDEGLYLAFGAGFSDGSFASNFWEFQVLEADLTTTVYDHQFRVALTGTAAVGYTWATPGYSTEFRLELEGGYRRALLERRVITNYCKCGSIISQTIQDAEGHFEAIAAMANGYVDFRVGNSRVAPYLGLGFGAVRVTRRDMSFAGVPVSGKYTHTGAWQMMGGFGYRLSPGAILELEFRQFNANTFFFDGIAYEQEFQQQEILVKFRLVG